MPARRLIRRDTATLENWTTQATTTYDFDNPAENPISWGSTATINNLDRSFLTTGSATTHLGALLTFTSSDTTPDEVWGAIVKIQPTFSAGDAPALELWTQDATSSVWTRQRRIRLENIVRTGDTLVLDMVFLASSVANVSAVWIALDPTASETVAWLQIHLYGDCTIQPVTPDCSTFTPPEDCIPTCSALFETWLCDPDDPDPPDPTFTLPPVEIEVDMATTYTYVPASQAYTHPCPGPTELTMYFGEMPSTGGAVVVDVIDSHGVSFAEGTSQTISAVGTMTWTVSAGFGPSTPGIGGGSANGYLPPVAVTPSMTFRFTAQGTLASFALLDVLNFFWTTRIAFDELC